MDYVKSIIGTHLLFPYLNQASYIVEIAQKAPTESVIEVGICFLGFQGGSRPWIIYLLMFFGYSIFI